MALMQAMMTGASSMQNRASKQLGPAHSQKKPGDWNCPQCTMLNFARNQNCRSCQAPNPDPEGCLAALQEGLALGYGGHTQKPGDWFCPSCNDLQFARNTQCRKCGAANPDPEGSLQAAQAAGAKTQESKQPQHPSLPGDWNCPACGDLQFARNEACRKCATPNPQGGFAGGQKRPFPGGDDGHGGAKKQKVCPMWSMMGSCMWGNNCWELHQ